jgi:hypothetical protein
VNLAQTARSTIFSDGVTSYNPFVPGSDIHQFQIPKSIKTSSTDIHGQLQSTYLDQMFDYVAVNTTKGYIQYAGPLSSPSSPTTRADCGNAACTQAVWDLKVDGYSCGERIIYLNTVEGYYGPEACKKVASEFPADCTCAPIANSTVLTTYCGNDACTQAVWNKDVDGASCGRTITWFEKQPNFDFPLACEHVATLFPSVCTCAPVKSGLSLDLKVWLAERFIDKALFDSQYQFYSLGPAYFSQCDLKKKVWYRDLAVDETDPNPALYSRRLIVQRCNPCPRFGGGAGKTIETSSPPPPYFYPPPTPSPQQLLDPSKSYCTDKFAKLNVQNDDFFNKGLDISSLDKSIALIFGVKTTIGQVCAFAKGLKEGKVDDVPGFCCLDAPYESADWGEKVRKQHMK